MYKEKYEARADIFLHISNWQEKKRRDGSKRGHRSSQIQPEKQVTNDSIQSNQKQAKPLTPDLHGGSKDNAQDLLSKSNMEQLKQQIENVKEL